jgi:hypothetical protein
MNRRQLLQAGPAALLPGTRRALLQAGPAALLPGTRRALKKCLTPA